MQVQISTDHNIEGHEKLSAHVTDVVETALRYVGDRVTRVEVHLSDDNGPKSGPGDKRCMMEARLEGHHPIAVTHHAATPGEAVDGAADKLARMIESTLGRLRDQNHRSAAPEAKPAVKS